MDIFFSALQPWHTVFGNNARGAGFTTIAVSGAILNGTIDYRKNALTNTLHLKMGLTVTVTGALHNPPYYHAGLTPSLPAGSRPAATVPFKMLVRYHNSNMLEASNVDYIRDVNAELTTAGDFAFGLYLPATATSYAISFNGVIPLD